jgi:V8-like Glu-specific endopeptidase
MNRSIESQERDIFENEYDPVTEINGNIGSPKVSQAQAMKLIWTKEDLERAIPYPMGVSEGDLRKAIATIVPEFEDKLSKDQAGAISGHFPEQQALTAPQATTGGYNYPGPYTRHEVGCPYHTFPYITIGKLFFKQYGVSYVGSAASIGNYAIWTAGHCVHAGDGKSTGWSTNLVFVPIYKDGSMAYGQWPAHQLWTRTNWYNKGNPNGLGEDMGGAVLYAQSGKKISQVVGSLGFAWNWSRYQHWHAIGYPAASPFNGQRMFATEASFAYLESSFATTPVTRAIGCDMTGGCSGGPWILKFGANNYLNGHNSYRLTSRPEEMKSPYFGNEAKSLYDNLKASIP